MSLICTNTVITMDFHPPSPKVPLLFLSPQSLSLVPLAYALSDLPLSLLISFTRPRILNR